MVLKTRRWDLNKGLMRLDALMVDPMATKRNAMKHIDPTPVNDALDALKEAPGFETERALKRAFKRYERDVYEYCVTHPIHSNLRADEEIVCPLLEAIYGS